MNMNEVLATLATRDPRLARAPERPRERLAVVERRLPDVRAHRRDAGAHRRPDPRARPPRRRARGQGRAVEGRRQVRPHAPDGCDARHPRPGVRRLRPPDASRHRARAGRRSRASPRFRSAAPPSAPASTRPLGFPQKVIELLVAETELPITEAKDHFEAQANRDGLVEASGALRTIAVSLTKINNDLRWMGSGPNTGLGELHIPDLQPGSSIMPGKVNPVIPEATLMVCARVIGNDATIAWAGASGLVRAQRRDPRHGHRAARVDPPARERDRACSPTRRSTASRPTSSAPPRSPACRRRSSRRSTSSSATRRRRRSPSTPSRRASRCAKR